MKKKLSKTKLIKSIIDYVFEKFCDNEQVALFMQDYYELEKRAEEKKRLKKDVSKCQNKCHDIFKITKEVRNFLEPLVDCEYFKNINYKPLFDPVPLYLAMEQLKTKQYLKLLEEMKGKK